MSKLKSDTQLTLLSRIPVMILSFLSVILLTRLLGPEGNGVYTYVYTVLHLLLTIIGFQLEGSLTYFLSNKQYENSKVFSSVTLLAFLSMVALIIVLTIVVFLIPGGKTLFIPPDQPVLFFFCFLIIAFFLRQFSVLVQSALRGLYRFKSFNAYAIVAQVIPVMVYAFLVLATFKGYKHFELETYFKIILLAESIVLLTGLGILFASKEIKFSSDFTLYQKPVLQYSSRNLVSVFGHFLNKRLDVWFVQHLKGTSALGQYGLATQIGNFIHEAMIPFNQVMFPYLAGSEPKEHKLIVGRIARLNLFIAVIAAMIVAGTSWLFIPILFGKQFTGAITATQILAIGIIFISQRLVFSNYFKATDQIRFPIRASWGGVLLTVMLDILLIPHYGINGASIATVVAYGFTSSYLVVHAARIMEMHAKDLFLLQKSDLHWLLSGRTRKRI